jgi:hypothetical protein
MEQKIISKLSSMNRKIDNMNTKLELLIEFVDKMEDGPNDGKLCKEYRDKINQVGRIYERNPDTGVIKSRKKGDYGNERIEHPTQEDIIAFNNKQSKENK